MNTKAFQKLAKPVAHGGSTGSLPASLIMRTMRHIVHGSCTDHASNHVAHVRNYEWEGSFVCDDQDKGDCAFDTGLTLTYLECGDILGCVAQGAPMVGST